MNCTENELMKTATISFIRRTTIFYFSSMYSTNSLVVDLLRYIEKITKAFSCTNCVENSQHNLTPKPFNISILKSRMKIHENGV